MKLNYNLYSQISEDLRLCGVKPNDPRKVKVQKNNVETDFVRYSDMFHKAGYEIAKHLLAPENKNIYQLDTFFFPLTFIYRHTLELILKAIGFKCIKNHDDRKKFIAETFHDLKKIFDEVDKQYLVVMPQEQKEWIITFLTNISSVDAASDSFRYPYHISCSKNFWGEKEYSLKRLFEKQTSIDLVKLVNKFEVAISILNNWYYEKNQLSYPKLNASFLETGGSYYSMSVLGYEYRKEDFRPYTDAYCEVAGFIRNHMENLFEDAKYQEAYDFFIPMCYLYRNCVELAQKEILFEETDKSLEEKCKIVSKYKHSIEGLWKAIEQYAQKCWSASSFPRTMTLLKQYCSELHGFDPEAIRFRYPINKNVDPVFDTNKRFDYGKTAEFFEAIINTIQGIGDELHEQSEYIKEMESEYRAEMESEMRNALGDYY